MHVRTFMAVGAAVGAATVARADFLGWAANGYVVVENGTEFAVLEVFAMFESTSDRLLNVFNSNLVLTGAASFFQDDAAGTTPTGGAWLPLPSDTSPLSDSFVTIGQPAGFANTTTLDPYFTNGIGPSASNAPSPDAGWYAIPPIHFADMVTTNQNDTGSNLGVLVGRFTIVGLESAATLKFLATAGYGDKMPGYEEMTDDETFTYDIVPAPGPMALLGLMALAGRRRPR